MDALANRTEYAYDGMGQILSMTRKGKTEERDITVPFTYDALGNITDITVPKLIIFLGLIKKIRILFYEDVGNE